LRGRLLVGLGLGKKVLVAKDGGHGQEHEGHGGAHIAPTTTAGALRLKIGILYFGQRILPIGWKRQPVGHHFFYGNGSRGMAGGAQLQSAPEWTVGTGRFVAVGTGSNPPGVKG
jgi:hypothetical protein